MNNPLHGGLVVAVIVLSSGIAPPVTAQWMIALEAQRSAYGGASKDTSAGAQGSFRPSRTRGLAVRLSRPWGRATTALGVRAAKSDIVIDFTGGYVGLTGEFKVVEFLPELSWRLVRTSRGATLELYGGPVLGWWAFEDLGKRFVPGATAGLHGVFPVFDRWGVSLRVGGSLMRSVFREGELPPEVVTRPMRRSEISLGLRYGR